MEKAMKIILDVFIIAAVVVIIMGIISRLIVKPILGIEAQAFLQFTHALLLFAIALGIRQLLRK